MTTANLGMTLPVVGADSDAWGDELNTALGLVDTFAGKLMGAAEVTVASATTCNIGTAASTVVAISGTTTITSLGSSTNTIRFVRFTGTSLVLTHNASSLILPRAANIQTAAGDTAAFVSDGSGNWRCLSYMPAGATLEHSNTGVSIGTSYTQLCTVTITAGKWRLSGNVNYSGGANNYVGAAIGTTTASSAGTVSGKSTVIGAVYSTAGVGSASISGFDVVTSGSVTYYLNAILSTNPDTCNGYLRAERII